MWRRVRSKIARQKCDAVEPVGPLGSVSPPFWHDHLSRNVHLHPLAALPLWRLPSNPYNALYIDGMDDGVAERSGHASCNTARSRLRRGRDCTCDSSPSALLRVRLGGCVMRGKHSGHSERGALEDMENISRRELGMTGSRVRWLEKRW